MSKPLSSLSPSKQNIKHSPLKPDHHKSHYEYQYDSFQFKTITAMQDSTFTRPSSADDDEFHDTLSSAPTSPQRPPPPFQSPHKNNNITQDIITSRSPLGSPRESTVRFDEGLTRAIGDMQQDGALDESVVHHQFGGDEGMSTIYQDAESGGHRDDVTDLTLSMDEKPMNDDITFGDLSTISAIPTDLTRFANLRGSPTKTSGSEAWSPSKQLRTSVIFNTPGTSHHQSQSQRPLHLLAGSRSSHSSNEDDEATPRRSNTSNDSPTDLLNFTGQSNILIPPPGSAPRTTRRSPSGRGAFPIRVNPSPTHRSQASVDRERSSGTQSPQKRDGYFADRPIPATPAESRRSMYAPNGLGLDLLDIDLEPMATPRSIPTVTPRELETLRSEMQSRISGLEATLSGKEAEVMALKRAITDAEVRVGNTSEELRNERAAKEDMEREKADLERRSREMEDVLRELKQNAFVEEREREKMRREVNESERKVEECEVKILELTASLETLSSDRVKSPVKISTDPNAPATPGTSVDVDAAVKQATESVARELHTLYKGKHERKVADLKVSYEKRWMRQVEQLKSDLKSSHDDLLKIQTERDATMSGVIPGMDKIQKEMERAEDEKNKLLDKNEKSEAERRILVAQVAGLEEQMGMVRSEGDHLRKELEKERIEKGDLVAQVDLFLTMSAQEPEPRSQPLPESPDGMRMDDSAQIGTNGNSSAMNSPSKTRNGFVAGVGGGRPRPMSMLKAPTAGKFSGIPAPGGAGKGMANGGVKGVIRVVVEGGVGF